MLTGATEGEQFEGVAQSAAAEPGGEFPVDGAEQEPSWFRSWPVWNASRIELAYRRPTAGPGVPAVGLRPTTQATQCWPAASCRMDGLDIAEVLCTNGSQLAGGVARPTYCGADEWQLSMFGSPMCEFVASPATTGAWGFAITATTSP